MWRRRHQRKHEAHAETVDVGTVDYDVDFSGGNDNYGDEQEEYNENDHEQEESHEKEVPVGP